MRRKICALLFVLIGTAHAGTPAQVLRLDFTGFEFVSMCNAETVTVLGGDITILLREDFAGSPDDVNGVHLLNRAVGSFSGVGLLTGDEYRVNVVAPSAFYPNVSVNNSNPSNPGAVANLLAQIEIINLSTPGSGVSKTSAVIVFVRLPSGEGENKVLEVSMECIGR